ncbi:hypothetical protein B296_00042147 [Ensete ventricosum]|uniref:Uncharacterized protein n=1 Tax=Ensete ventricosum TaxID=4639 RepID=A0A426YAS5_ENSVE|nr:hypothetical protein B296_00042147 [Ensete ventricosum]
MGVGEYRCRGRGYMQPGARSRAGPRWLEGAAVVDATRMLKRRMRRKKMQAGYGAVAAIAAFDGRLSMNLVKSGCSGVNRGEGLIMIGFSGNVILAKKDWTVLLDLQVMQCDAAEARSRVANSLLLVDDLGKHDDIMDYGERLIGEPC